ncbi:MAG: tRNA (adenosine(37)-N6)-threonylcarbamoyltransferase complex ATPase subunit type 1 TsaE [Pseudomonadota bacterium]|nr:tRNA (adenosine(37)-N6)-threonylcarbamoyltransferase complex ATPase subunit type 1 TsaE [Pseudomonadota bacterium]
MSPILETRTEHWPDEAACVARAAALAAALSPDARTADVFIELEGPLGAGKTTFARHLLHALGVVGRIKSPTYTLIEPYTLERPDGALAISHFDFYRFEDPQEWEDAGLRDIFAAPGLKLVEWPENAAGLLPGADLRIHIEPLEVDARRVRLEAGTARGRELLP